MSSPQVENALQDATLPDYVRTLGLVGRAEPLVVEPAGDGNINWVRRVRAPSGRSWIVKQARPALERFPEYRASTERIVFEHRWLEVARPLDRGRVCPEVVCFDEQRRVLVLEDLGAAERLDHALARGADVVPALRALANLLGALHASTAGRHAELAPRFRNDEMRRLHGDHVFHLPFRANDFPLADALRAAAERVWADGDLVALADRAYVRYLEPRGALVHGDVQAGNVLLAARGPVLLDAEIAHVGDPAFDVGTLVAHVVLAAIGRGAPAAAMPAVRAVLESHAVGAAALGADTVAGLASAGDVSFAEVARYAAIEVLRRTIGAARVAAVADPEAALAALALAIDLIRTPPADLDAFASALAAAAVHGRSA
jgi:5-methylthioribose kinase